MSDKSSNAEMISLLSEIRDLLEAQKTEKVKVDVKSMVKELSSGQLNGDIVHLYQWNMRWAALLDERNRRAAKDTYDFIDSEMEDVVFCKDQFEFIRSRSADMIEKDGYILDLGVYKGGSTRALASIFPDHEIHGFDSFEGLPGDWSHVLAGAFGDVKGVLPDMPDNVKLYKGWFDDTLPEWKKKYNKKKISILRVDCDIYSSTKTIFDTLESLIDHNTWIVFDELIGYRGWRDHEHKAFMEFIKKTKYKYDYMAYGLTYTVAKLRK